MVVSRLGVGLEVEADLRSQGTRSDVVRAAKGRKEIIERGLIRQVDGGEPQAPLVTVTVEKIIVPDASIEKTARRDALRIVIVIFFSRRGNLEKYGTEAGCIAGGERRSRGTRSSQLAIAGEPGLKFLVSGKGQPGDAVYQGDLPRGDSGVGSPIRDRRRR